MIDEGPAYGAALLAGLAAGVFAGVDDASARARLRDEVIEPDDENAKRYDELYAINLSLYPVTREAMHALTRVAQRD